MSWTAPAADGDSPITGYTVTPYIGSDGADAGAGRRVGDERDDHRPDQRHALHVQGHGHERGRHRARVGAPRRGHAAGHDLRLRRRRRPSTRATATPVELGVKFKTDFAGSVTGIRFYKAAANTGTHIGSLWIGDRHAPRAGDVHQRDGLRLAARDVLQPGRGHGGHDLRRVVLRARTATTRSTAGGLAAAVDNAPLHALANATSANGVYAYGAVEHVPDEQLRRQQLLGRRAVRARRRPGRSPASTATAGQAVGERLAGPRPRAAARSTSYEITPYIGSTRADADDRHRHAAGDEQDDHRPDRGHRLHVHGAGAQPERRRAGLRALERGHADGAGAPAAPTGVTAQAGLELRARELDGAEQRRRQRDHRATRSRRSSARRRRRRSASARRRPARGHRA